MPSHRRLCADCFGKHHLPLHLRPREWDQRDRKCEPTQVFDYCKTFDLDYISVDEPANHILDQVARILSEPCPYLSPQNQSCLLSVLRLFCKASVTLYEEGESKVRPVSEIRLRKLGAAMETWLLRGISEGPFQPMVVTYGLELVKVLRDHLFGATVYDANFNTSWEILPILHQREQKELSPLGKFEYLNDSRFKGDITRHHFPFRAKVTVPTGCKIQVHYLNDLQLESFSFLVKRCHLSQGWDHYLDFNTHTDESPVANLLGNMRFFGSIIEDSTPNRMLHELAIGEVSVQWLTHIYDGKGTLLPISDSLSLGVQSP